MNKTRLTVGVLGLLIASGCAGAGDLVDEAELGDEATEQVVEPEILAEATDGNVHVTILGGGEGLALSIMGPLAEAERFSPLALRDLLPSEAFTLLTSADAPQVLLDAERAKLVQRLPTVERKLAEKDALHDWFYWNNCNFEAAAAYIDSLNTERWGGEVFNYPHYESTQALTSLNTEYKVPNVTWSYHAAYARRGTITSNVYWKTQWKNGVLTTYPLSQTLPEGYVHNQYTFAGWTDETCDPWWLPLPKECFVSPRDATVIQGIRNLGGGDAASSCDAFWGYPDQNGAMTIKERSCSSPLDEPFWADSKYCAWANL